MCSSSAGAALSGPAQDLPGHYLPDRATAIRRSDCPSVLVDPHSPNRPSGTVLLGTIALEPNRWGLADPGGRPRTDVAPLVPAIAEAGFDGIELWERHLPTDRALPCTIFNSYVGFDDPDPTARAAAAEAVRATGAAAVKFNVGADPDAVDAYAARVQAWIDLLPPHVVALCECHAGISVAEDPEVAARLFAAVDRPGRVGAIVHTHESAEHVRRRFAAYGPLIAHVHVNFLDPATLTVPPLAERADVLRERAALLAELGFAGSWTIEFVHGTGTDRDQTDLLLAQAADDLVALRRVLAEVGR